MFLPIKWENINWKDMDIHSNMIKKGENHDTNTHEMGAIGDTNYISVCCWIVYSL